MTKRGILILLSVFVVSVFSLVALGGTSALDFGTNWTVQYFNNPTLSGSPVATQSGIPGINFNWGAGSPISGTVPNDQFSARFTSTQTFAQGTYQFVASSDDGIRVYIDNTLALDRFIGRPLTTDTFNVTLTAGAHNLTVEYFEGIDQAIIQFQWFLVSGGGGTPGTPGVVPTSGPTPTPTAVPPTQLPPIPPGALTATVIRASVLNVRSAPFLGAPRVGRILRGQTYAVVGRDPDARWFLLQLSGTQAWAWGYYLFVNGNEFNAPVTGAFATSGGAAATSGVVVQTEATLKLRAAPNVYSQQIGRVPWGDILPVIGKTQYGDWYQVVFRGTTGWIASAFVNLVEGDINNVPVTG